MERRIRKVTQESGPCVEKYLRENEVEVEEDWICKLGQDSGK